MVHGESGFDLREPNTFAQSLGGLTFGVRGSPGSLPEGGSAPDGNMFRYRDASFAHVAVLSPRRLLAAEVGSRVTLQLELCARPAGTCRLVTLGREVRRS